MHHRKNKGSTIVEVTMLMPGILFLFVLGIGMLLHAYKQGAAHGKLMTIHRRECETADGTFLLGTWAFDGKTYTEDVESEAAHGYTIYTKECVILRVADKENDLRRLDTYGDAIRERRVSPVPDS